MIGKLGEDHDIEVEDPNKKYKINNFFKSMYTNETKYYTVKSNIDFDYSKHKMGKDRRVELTKKINKFLDLKVLLFQDISNYKKINISLSISGKSAFRGIKSYDVEYDPEGITAKEAFHKYDSTGKLNPTREPVLLSEIFRCKASVNLHIKMWAGGLAELTFPEFYDYMDEIGAPEWVVEAVKKQAKKIVEDRVEKRGCIF